MAALTLPALRPTTIFVEGGEQPGGEMWLDWCPVPARLLVSDLETVVVLIPPPWLREYGPPWKVESLGVRMAHVQMRTVCHYDGHSEVWRRYGWEPETRTAIVSDCYETVYRRCEPSPQPKPTG